MEQCPCRRTLYGPYLADGEVLFVVKHLPIDRIIIVVARNGNKVGLSVCLETIHIENDKLSTVKKRMNLTFEYLNLFKTRKVAKTPILAKDLRQ